MEDLNIVLDASSPVSLQHQLRQKLINAIYTGALQPGQRVPSTRSLARRIEVSRNTVSLAYDALISEGHLDSRPRSGIYVARDLPGARIATGRRDNRSGLLLASRLRAKDSADEFQLPGNWQQYPYPFIDGGPDFELLPVDEWREAMRLACTRHELSSAWLGPGDRVSVDLVEQIRSKVLPAQGIVAAAGEVVTTQSARHALQLLAGLLIQRGTPVVLEEPADEGLVAWLRQRSIASQTLDASMREALPPRAVIVTSAQRSPLWDRPKPQALLDAASEADAIVLEHDAPFGVLGEGRATPALRALASADRVVYVGSLAPWVSCEQPLGVVVAAAPLIERLRKDRRAQGTVPSTVMRRAWAYFISLGHYSAALIRTSRLLESRKVALRDALNHYLHKSVRITTLPGATAYWVQMKDGQGVQADELARRALKIGVLLQPVRSHDGDSAICLGFTSLDDDKIRSGVKALSRLLRGDLSETPDLLRNDSVKPLDGAALEQAMSGVRLVYNTVYGEPCTLELLPNGQLQGVAGHAGEDCDRGRWWIEDGRWFRQWQRWAYAEAYGFRVVIDGDQVRWYDDNGMLADVAVIIRSSNGAPDPA